jgi:thioredoxin reductase
VVDSGGIGGQAAASSLIRNYLGFGKGISGGRLAEEAYEQAAAFGASFLLLNRVTALDRSGEWFDALPDQDDRGRAQRRSPHRYHGGRRGRRRPPVAGGNCPRRTRLPLTGDDVGDQEWPLERRSLSLETSMPGVLAAGDIRHVCQARRRRGGRGLDCGPARSAALRRGRAGFAASDLIIG